MLKPNWDLKTLQKLSSKSYLSTKEGDIPHCQIEDLIENKKDLIVLSGGLDSLISNLIKKNRTKELEKIISEIKNSFINEFYFEIQRHNDIGEKILKKFI